jgi:hypothetical protein
MSRAKPPFFVWGLVAFVLLLILQGNPYTGIFLMALGGSAWCGLAVHAFLLGLLVEAALGKIPRFLMIVPLVAYGGYYVMYVKQGLEIDAKARQMQLSNSSIVGVHFDPTRHSLVLPHPQAELLVSYFGVPVAYEVVHRDLDPGGYLSYRLLDFGQCVRARRALMSLRGQTRSPGALDINPVRFEKGALNEVCVLRIPDKPSSQQIVVTTRGEDKAWQRERHIMEQFIDFSLNGEVVATYSKASVWRLPALPMFAIGCGLNGGNASWDCFADFFSTHQVIDEAPKSPNKALHDPPEAIVLGLRRSERTDYTDFKGDSRSSALIESIEAYPQRRKEELLAQFVEFVHDSGGDMTRNGVFVGYKGTSEPPQEMTAVFREQAEQLAPLRDAIVARFVQLTQAKTSHYEHWYRSLERALIELPRASYATMPDRELSQLLEVLALDAPRGNFWKLYRRTADAGPRTLNHYETYLSKGDSSLAALAICRIGEASEQTRAILRAAFTRHSQSDTNEGDIVIASAMFVALLRLGDPAAVDAYPTNLKRADVIGWYEAVRQGKGRTDIGPNNCQSWLTSEEQRNGSWLPPSLQAGVVYTGKAWVEAAKN